MDQQYTGPATSLLLDLDTVGVDGFSLVAVARAGLCQYFHLPTPHDNRDRRRNASCVQYAYSSFCDHYNGRFARLGVQNTRR